MLASMAEDAIPMLGLDELSENGCIKRYPCSCYCHHRRGETAILQARAAPDDEGQGEGKQRSHGSPANLHNGGLALH
jgi:hypothetical protein